MVTVPLASWKAWSWFLRELGVLQAHWRVPPPLPGQTELQTKASLSPQREPCCRTVPIYFHL